MQNDLETLTELNNQYLQNYQDGNAEAFARLLNDDFRETDQQGNFLDREPFLAKIAALEGKVPFTFSAEDVSIRIFDNVAVVHATTKLSAEDGSTRSGGRYTDVWLRTDAGWQAIAAQIGV